MDPEREVMATLLTTNAQMVAHALSGGEDDGDSQSMVRAIAATRSLAMVVDDTMRALVDSARKDGLTWAEIGDVLHVSRQAAFQRFGASVRESGPDREITMREVQDAFDRAVSILDDFLDEGFARMRSTFDQRMRERCSVELLRAVRRKLETEVGPLQELGKPAVSVRAGYAVVKTPILFERGERTGIVTLDADKQVAGFFVMPPESA